MEKTKVWSVPEGYELDKDQSTETKVVLKKIEYNKRADSWKEYCDMMKGKNSYVVDMYGNIRTTYFSNAPVVGEFEDKEDAVTFAAFSRLLKLRKNWVGDWKPDWTNEDQSKFVILSIKNRIDDVVNDFISRSMSFPTREMRDEFLANFKDLLEQAKPLL